MRKLPASKNEKASYARDLATYLNVSEAELTHARVGHDAKRLHGDVRDILTALSQTVGEVRKPLLVMKLRFMNILVNIPMLVLTIMQD